MDDITHQTRYFLGVDYGKAHVGLAMADEETRMAFPYGTIDNNKDLVKNLLAIIEKENVSKVIIGIPSYINRDETEYDGEKLGEYLKNVEKINVFYENEMFSTRIAHEHLKERKAKNFQHSDHEEAAKVILESWMGRML